MTDNTKEEKKPERPPKRTACYISRDYFADAVFHEGEIKFAKIYFEAGRGPEWASEIITEEGKKYLPLSLQETDIRLLRLPVIPNGHFESNEDILKLFEETKSAVSAVWDAGNEIKLKLFCLWIFASYRFDLIGIAPYLRLRGPYGSGKTRGLNVIAHLALRPISIGPALTEAVVYRLCEEFKPCACLNEFDEKGQGDYASLAVQLLNSRYERGHPIGRMGGANLDQVQLFEPFGPTAFSARAQFSDASLESRCIDLECSETSREDIPTNITPEDFEARFSPLRNRLYLGLRFRKIDLMSSDEMPETEEMPRRFKQGLTALFQAIPKEVRPVLLEVMNALKTDERRRLQESDEGEIWLALFDKVRDEPHPEITGEWVAELIGLDSRRGAQTGGRRLSTMGFSSRKKHRIRVWICPERLWNKTAARLGIIAPPYPWSEQAALNEARGTSAADASDVRGTSGSLSDGRGREKPLSPPDLTAASAASDVKSRRASAARAPQDEKTAADADSHIPIDKP